MSLSLPVFDDAPIAVRTAALGIRWATGVWHHEPVVTSDGTTVVVLATDNAVMARESVASGWKPRTMVASVSRYEARYIEAVSRPHPFAATVRRKELLRAAENAPAVGPFLLLVSAPGGRLCVRALGYLFTLDAHIRGRIPLRLQRRYLVSALRWLRGEFVCLHWGDLERPVLINSLGDDTRAVVVMQVRP